MEPERLQLDFPAAGRRSTLISSDDPGRLLDFLPPETLVITDGTVNRLYGHLLPSSMPRLVLPAGEKSKSMQTTQTIYRFLLRRGADRSSFLLGLGGGVICDISAFAAATFMRGLPCALAPTTLLAQVDAAIGGKNGINLDGYKNLVGTITQPAFIFISPAFLGTLPGRLLACGFAEMIKAAAIADADLFDLLAEHRSDLTGLEREQLSRAIKAAVKIKTSLVMQDEFEKGSRKKLNFGHSLGHALEKNMTIEHGEAVAIGMAAAAYISERLGLLAASAKKRLLDLLEAYGLPRQADCPWPPLAQALGRDKKKTGRTIDLVLLRKIGTAEIVRMERTQARKYYHDLHKLWSN